jgi:hypothetical protein
VGTVTVVGIVLAALIAAYISPARAVPVFHGTIGGTSIDAVGPNNEFPIIPIGLYYPPNPCTGTTCQSSGPLIVGDPDAVGTWSVAVAQTPLPTSLPLFATGLGALGLLGWRRRHSSAIAG